MSRITTLGLLLWFDEDIWGYSFRPKWKATSKTKVYYEILLGVTLGSGPPTGQATLNALKLTSNSFTE